MYIGLGGSFNSLQTGRTFRTQSRVGLDGEMSHVSIPFKREGLSERVTFEKPGVTITIKFQFPSNGKDFPNEMNDVQKSTLIAEFQFPSNGKDFPNRFCLLEALLQRMKSFNSLQTGRTFRTDGEIETLETEGLFQFPSNGKDFPNLFRWCTNCTFFTVSIPFKREGLSELQKSLSSDYQKIRFQFPSNGKDFPNIIYVVMFNYVYVRFNSLQTGRTFRTPVLFL